MQKSELVLGIDVGSVTAGVVVMNNDREVVYDDYRFHHGEIETALVEMLAGFDRLGKVCLIGATASTPGFIRADQRYNNEVAAIAAARHELPQLRGLLLVGGEKFSLSLFDSKGHYQSTLSNTSCAAGTGSFLDQQAGRLGLKDTRTLSDIAYQCSSSCPKIASRCAVFAKTDLIHAQQEGYQLDEISNGLCRGLAKNIVDTLFVSGSLPEEIVFCGGVSRNRSVADHISDMTGCTLVIPEKGYLYGAMGTALSLVDDETIDKLDPGAGISSPAALFRKKEKQREYYHEPLTLKISEYPDFSSRKTYEYSNSGSIGVEVDIYEDLTQDVNWSGYLGIDIGSTSTKAVLVTPGGAVISGFYTRTAGRPLSAIQEIFRAMADIERRYERTFTVMACGTTGSGRKFIGTIIGADTIVDEITAHARAALELNPDVDTIIEIGGQDAKFTTLSDGRVTASTMNNVCAAGTGSFIEEQAAKLGCRINEYSGRTENVAAPMVSDRCTVFMERDINHLLNEGYGVDEVLAAALHSVRENYLLKVACESNIGNVVFFQGATAKNRSLVAAFEQRLRKPILVSKFCHLTGALGAALILLDEKLEKKTGFIGIDLHSKTVPIRSEICELCNNHCKLTIAEIDGQSIGYGFLCGRDYDTASYVKKRNNSYVLLKERKRFFHVPGLPETSGEISIGLPSAVHMVEDISLWQRFFFYLSIPTVTSGDYMDAVAAGKRITKAEFCAPVTAMHGHVDYLRSRADYVFLPVYLENKVRDARRQYCYYTQYLPSLTSLAVNEESRRILMPVLRYLYTTFHTKMQLYRMLKPITRRPIGFLEISQAYDHALNAENEAKKRLKEHFLKRLEKSGSDRLGVVFLGRPYNVLEKSMNCGIPDIFNGLDVDTFYQDMLSYADEDLVRIRPLLKELHWQYAARIIEAAEVVAGMEGLYPVYVTSFKCSPDSFGVDYFKRIMAYHEKPYLILELDEHDSSVGYETRIEAAVRSFKNHRERTRNDQEPSLPVALSPDREKDVGNKTLVFPNWDPLTCSFLVSVLQREGVDAILMEETDQSIRQSLKHNSGQCIPLNAVAQGYMETIRNNDLDPSKTLLWLNWSSMACNIRLYPHHIRTILADHGFADAGIYTGELSFAEFGLRAIKNAYFAYYFGGMLRKTGCRIRPYERNPGETDRVLTKAAKMVGDSFLGKRDKEKVLDEIITRFQWIETEPDNRPKVAIFGDLYSRDNEVMNQGLIRFIEKHGGEVITTPYSEYAKMIAKPYFRKWFNEGQYLSVLSNSAALATMKQMEKTYHAVFNRILEEPEHEYNEPVADILARFNVAPEHTGESMDNLLKVHYLKKYNPDLSLFVQASPALCCASLITEAMRDRIEEVTGVPVVSVTYDGTGGLKNEVVIPYLKFPRQKSRGPVSEKKRADRHGSAS